MAKFKWVLALEEYIRLGNPFNDGEQRLAKLRKKLETTQ
jgi:hypothetical protein